MNDPNHTAKPRSRECMATGLGGFGPQAPEGALGLVSRLKRWIRSPSQECSCFSFLCLLIRYLKFAVQFSSVAQSCLTLCDPMNHSTPGLPVHHQLPESTQTHVHRISDAIPAISSSVIPFSSCPQSLPASRYFPMSQLFAWSGQSILGLIMYIELHER